MLDSSISRLCPPCCSNFTELYLRSFSGSVLKRGGLLSEIFLVCLYLAFLIPLSLLILSCSDLTSVLKMSPQCGSCLGKEACPLWFLKPLGSRLLRPLHTFECRPLRSPVAGEGKTAPSSHCGSHVGMLFSGLGGASPMACDFPPQSQMTQVTLLLVRFLH